MGIGRWLVTGLKHKASGGQRKKCHNDGTPGRDRGDGSFHAEGGWRWVAGAGPGELEEGPVVAIDIGVGVHVSPATTGEHDGVSDAFVEVEDVELLPFLGE